MSGTRALALALYAVWSAWLLAAQSLAGAGAFVPDLALVLALALVARGRPGDVPLLALLFALARSALAIDPPLAVAAGAGAVLALARGLRSVVESAGPLPRALIAGAAAFAFDAWLIGVHHARHPALAEASAAGALPAGALSGALAVWPAALATALAALLLAPALVRLPGLSPLWRPRW